MEAAAAAAAAAVMGEWVDSWVMGQAVAAPENNERIVHIALVVVAVAAADDEDVVAEEVEVPN